MQYFKKVPFNNLSIIQEKVFSYFPVEKINKTQLFYPPNSLEIFLNIKELYDELQNISIIENVESIAWNIVQKVASPIHIDTGIHNYSLNIPIYGYKNTLVNFYKTDVKPVFVKTPTNISAFLYPKETNFILINSLELADPHIINVKEPHQVVNHNAEPRITLLIRLKNFQL